MGDGNGFRAGTSGALRSELAGGKNMGAAILEGSNSSGSTVNLEMSFRTISGAENDAGRLSDVFRLTGTGTDVFVLQLSVAGLAANDYLGWLDEDTNLWVNATDGNTGSGALAGFHALSFQTFLTNEGGSNAATMLGACGNDGAGNVWAVLDHNSEFAAIPEPTTSLLLAAGLGVWVLTRMALT